MRMGVLFNAITIADMPTGLQAFVIYQPIHDHRPIRPGLPMAYARAPAPHFSPRQSLVTNAPLGLEPM